MAKVDLFKEILPAINSRNRDFYKNTSDDLRNSSNFNFWMIHRWLTCSKANKAYYIELVNELCNKDSSAIKDHPELQWLLLTCIGRGKEQYWKEWVGVPNSREAVNPIDKFLLDVYPNINSYELSLLKSTNTKDDLKQLAKDMGYNEDEITNIFDGKTRNKSRK